MTALGRREGTPTPRHVIAATDAQLMARVRDGDHQALAELYDRFGDRAYRLSLAICHDRGRAEDAVQESFVSIWRGRASYQGDRGTVASWLLSVVRHRAIDIGRLDGRLAARCSARGEFADRSSAEDVESDVLQTDEARRLRALLQQLPDAQREVITLAYYGQLTHTEIAERLGLPPGTIKGRMRLGLEKLHRSITDQPA